MEIYGDHGRAVRRAELTLLDESTGWHCPLRRVKLPETRAVIREKPRAREQPQGTPRGSSRTLGVVTAVAARFGEGKKEWKAEDCGLGGGESRRGRNGEKNKGTGRRNSSSRDEVKQSMRDRRGEEEIVVKGGTMEAMNWRLELHRQARANQGRPRVPPAPSFFPSGFFYRSRALFLLLPTKPKTTNSNQRRVSCLLYCPDVSDECVEINRRI